MSIDRCVGEEAEIVQIRIRKTQIVQGEEGPVVLYQVDLSNAYREWTVLKRFKFFKDLQSRLRREFGREEVDALLSRVPSRKFKLFVDHLGPDFVQERRLKLEGFCQSLLRNPSIVNSDTVLDFFLC